MIYYSSKEPFDFKTFKTIKSFGENTHSSKITINAANEEQADLIEYILNFNNKLRRKNKDDKKIREMFLILQKKLYEGRELVINAFNSGLFPLKLTVGKGLQILTPKQML